MNHYTADTQIKTIEELKQFFPDGKCNEMNFNGCYKLIRHGTMEKNENY